MVLPNGNQRWMVCDMVMKQIFYNAVCLAASVTFWSVGVTVSHAQNATSSVAPVSVTEPAKPAVTETNSAEAAPAKEEEESGVTKLIGAGGLEPFYTWIAGAGVFIDPHGVFTMEKGMLRVSGERTGYLATRKEFSDYRLVAEYKWGEGKYGDRIAKPRNSGLLIHGVGEDREWMRGFECQIAEDRTGNIVIHNGAKMTMGTNTYVKSWTEVGKTKQELEKKHGEWNTLEVFSVGGRVRVLINGQQSIEAESLMPNRGKLLIQSNGAEIFFRRLDIYPLEKMPESPVKTADAGKPDTSKTEK